MKTRYGGGKMLPQLIFIHLPDERTDETLFLELPGLILKLSLLWICTCVFDPSDIWLVQLTPWSGSAKFVFLKLDL